MDPESLHSLVGRCGIDDVRHSINTGLVIRLRRSSVGDKILETQIESIWIEYSF